MHKSGFMTVLKKLSPSGKFGWLCFRLQAGTLPHALGTGNSAHIVVDSIGIIISGICTAGSCCSRPCLCTEFELCTCSCGTARTRTPTRTGQWRLGRPARPKRRCVRSLRRIISFSTAPSGTNSKYITPNDEFINVFMHVLMNFRVLGTLFH